MSDAQNASQPVSANDGAGNKLTSQVSGSQQALDVGIDVAGVQIDPRQIRTLTSSDTVNVNNLPATVNTNYGAVGASTIRSAAQVGNATGAADFNNGATGAQTQRVAANLAVAGADVTNSNPVPVVISNSVPGTLVNKYNTTVNLAVGSSTNQDYAVTASKTLSVHKWWVSASGRIRADLQTSPDGTTFTTFWTGFNSAAEPNIFVDLTQIEIQVTGTGSKARVVITNDDKTSTGAFDVFSTISGIEN